MKRLFKKLRVVLSSTLLACLAIAGMLFASGCEFLFNDPADSTIETELLPEISFSVSEKELLIGDEEYLKPNYEKMSGYSLSYQSSNPSVVSVDNRGKITAVSEGNATVKAIYSNGEKKAEASLTVNSSFGGYLPELKTMGVANDIAITVDGAYMLLPYIAFNGKEISDAEFYYSIVDGAIAEITEQGEIKAKSRGKTELVIEAVWCGKDKTNTPTMQKTINLSVIDDMRFFNDGAPIIDETIYTLSEFEGKAYRNSLPCNFHVQINGADETADIVIENEEILTQQEGYLVANAFGKTKVSVEKDVDGIVYSMSFEVQVQRIEKTITDTIPLFNTMDGTYLDVSSGSSKQVFSFIGVEDEVVDAYQANKPLVNDNGNIMGVVSSSAISRGTAAISVGTETVLYHFTLETLTKAISTKEDLKVLELSNAEVITGYYEVIADIDATGLSLNHTTLNNACFSGVFNGGGHVISNLTLKAESSMFGVLNADANVKNFALTNLNATKAYFLAENTLNDAGLTMSNLYIQLDPATVSPRGLTGRTGQTSVCKNIVIEYLGENAEKNRTYEDRYAWQGLIGGMWRRTEDGKYYAQDKQWSDVYVISPFVVSFRSDEAVDKNNPDLASQVAVYGYGANETVDIYGNSLDASLHTRPNPNLGANWWKETYLDAKYTNLYHYEDYAALKNASKNYDTFSGEYWVVYDNQIVWKSLMADRITTKAFLDKTELTADTKITKTGEWLNFKAYVDGVEVNADNVTVSIEANEYITWKSNSLFGYVISEGWYVSKLPETNNVKIKVSITIHLGDEKFVQTLTLVLRGRSVTPVQPGGEYDTEDRYETGTTVPPIQSGEDYNSDDYDFDGFEVFEE